MRGWKEEGNERSKLWGKEGTTDTLTGNARRKSWGMTSWSRGSEVQAALLGTSVGLGECWRARPRLRAQGSRSFSYNTACWLASASCLSGFPSGFL